VPEEWDGYWFLPDGPVFFQVEDPARGVLLVAGIERHHRNNETPGAPAPLLKLATQKVYLRNSGEWIFASLQPPNSTDTKFIFFRLKKQDKMILAWAPNTEKFAELVRRGELPGSIDDKGNVTLGSLRPTHYQKITSGEYGVLFNWDNPLVFFRLIGP